MKYLFTVLCKVKGPSLSKEPGGFEERDTAVSGEDGGVADSPMCFGLRCWCSKASSNGSERGI